MTSWPVLQLEVQAIVGSFAGVTLVIFGLVGLRRSRAWSVVCLALGELLAIGGFFAAGSALNFTTSWFGPREAALIGCSLGLILALIGGFVWHRSKSAAMLSFVFGAILAILVLFAIYVSEHCGPCP
jgi:sulfite exporter TauE/SafE